VCAFSTLILLVGTRVLRPVKIVAHITYTVSGDVKPCSINQSIGNGLWKCR